MRFWIECGDFIRESRRHFRDTGALLPSSRFLARALVSELRKWRVPSRILEVGPGTGSVTSQILRHLAPGDRLDLVEGHRPFINMLQWRFMNIPPAVVRHLRLQGIGNQGSGIRSEESGVRNQELPVRCG